jgi:hypothetical protein
MLGGAPPRRGAGRWRGRSAGEPGDGRAALLGFAAACLLAVGAVGGFAWEMDRQLRGGLLRQHTQAAARPDWVSLRALPPGIPRIFVAVVDPGFNARGPLAEIDVPERFTLTRELVRHVHLLGDDLPGEARTLVMAPLLQHHLPKRSILELYLNRVRFGRSGGAPVYGLYHAAREFFDKEPAALTVGEVATLAGLLLEPRIQDPQRRPGAVGARRNEVLGRLLDQGIIDAATYRRAQAEPLGFQPGLEHAPMSRPAGWNRPLPLLRVTAPPAPAEPQP